MISVIITTCGDQQWSDLAWARAYPSAARQDCEIVKEHYPDLTVEQARNAGAAKAKRPYLCFLDADDELDDGYIEAMTDRIRQGDVLALYAPAVSWIEPTPEGMSLASEPVFPGLPASMPPMNHCVTATVVSAWLLDHVGGWKDGYWPWPDYELWLRCLAAGARIEYVRDAVYRYHLRPDSANHTLSRSAGTKLGNRIHREHQRRLADAAAHRADLVPPA